MKKLYINTSGSIIFDPETDEMSSVRVRYPNIRTMYYIEEECDIVAQAGEQRFEAHVVPGDILIQFYRDDKPNRFIIVKNDEWKKNIEEDIVREQKDKEEWAAKNKMLNEFTPREDTCGPCCDGCEACPKGSDF